MSDHKTDIELVANFLGDALSGKFVVSFSSMKTIQAFKRLSADSSEHVVLGLCQWFKDDDAALQKFSDAVIKTYEKCSPEIRSEAAEVFNKLADRIMEHGG